MSDPLGFQTILLRKKIIETGRVAEAIDCLFNLLTTANIDFRNVGKKFSNEVIEII